MPLKFTDTDKLEAVKRELAQRQRVYPRLVEAGSMTRAFADRQIALMAEIVADYERQVKTGDLFGGVR